MLKKIEPKDFCGVMDDDLVGKIPRLNPKHYNKLYVSLAGDAPKDLIKLYEYDDYLTVPRKRYVKYIAKVGHKWYPNESLTEYLMYRIGEALGLNMALSKIVFIDNQIRFLSRFFLNKKQTLIHGADIFTNHINDREFVEYIENTNRALEFFTFNFTREAIMSVFPHCGEKITNDFVKLLIFDAIVGNNDRHMYNWAVIVNLNNSITPKFSPIYDTARGLFWNISEKKVKNYLSDERSLEKYIESSRPKTGWENIQEINHFILIREIYRHYPQYQEIIKIMLNKSSLEDIKKMITESFSLYFSVSRLQLILKCLDIRFYKLINIISHEEII